MIFLTQNSSLLSQLSKQYIVSHQNEFSLYSQGPFLFLNFSSTQLNLTSKTLGLQRECFKHSLSLLMSAFLLLMSSPNLTAWLFKLTEHSATNPTNLSDFAASENTFNPIKFSVQKTQTSELLRFHHRVAASKPTSWLLKVFNFL